ncbi:hypothetical protein IC757_13245 [Wenzhouxiangella sp. AB-CW3]|uniref:Ig-like domain-containing protein n=1 Tax=Wenzhouxiangella sp. AB-CW3 TaxID=2771012 RepID=UPI00168B9671|nr:Ig-like domain-containing protein [Wenzhouxiangella sp. AB-CW3]QOC21983.1 hypothetical protein IC757_13245 [Wenzhouxiangella sp. AB-CW3]
MLRTVYACVPALAVCLFATPFSMLALADDVVIIDGVEFGTTLLPSGTELIVESTGVIEPPDDARGIDAEVGTRITVDGGRIETVNGNAIATRSHSDITIVNGAELLSGDTTTLNLAARANVLVQDSTLSDDVSADERLTLEIIDSGFSGNVRGNEGSRVKLVNTTPGRVWLDSDAIVEIFNSTVSDRLRFSSNVELLLDEQSALNSRISADHNLELDLRGPLILDDDVGLEGRAGISADSNARIHMRGGGITGQGIDQLGIDIGGGGVVRLSDGASIDTPGNAIEMIDSGTVVIESGSVVTSAEGASVNHGDGLVLSVNNATLTGQIDTGESSQVSLHQAIVNGHNRAVRVGEGSLLTISGANTSISALSGRVVDVDDGSRMILLDGKIEAPAGSDANRPINLGRGAELFVHGGQVLTGVENRPGIRGNRSRVEMTGGSIEATAVDAPGIYFFAEGSVAVSGSTSITTTGDRESTDPQSGAHGAFGRSSVFEINGGEIDIQGSGNFGLLGLEESLIVMRNGQVLADSALDSYSLGAFEESIIRIQGLADDFTVDIDGSVDGPQPVVVGEGQSVSLVDLYPEFADSDPFSGVIDGTWSDGESFSLSFTNQYEELAPGEIVLRGVAADPEPDPGTETTIDSLLNPSEVDEVVTFVVEVSNPDAAPDDGLVTVTATSAETCQDSDPAVSGNTATYSCEIAFETVGDRGVEAGFTDLEAFEDSTSQPIIQTVNLGLFIDRFEEDPDQ